MLTPHSLRIGNDIVSVLMRWLLTQQGRYALALFVYVMWRRRSSPKAIEPLPPAATEALEPKPEPEPEPEPEAIVTVSTDPEEVGLDSLRLQRVSQWVSKCVSEDKVPGMLVGIVKHGKLCYLHTAGSMDVEAGKPLTPSTIFRMYVLGFPRGVVCVDARLTHTHPAPQVCDDGAGHDGCSADLVRARSLPARRPYLPLLAVFQIHAGPRRGLRHLPCRAGDYVPRPAHAHFRPRFARRRRPAGANLRAQRSLFQPGDAGDLVYTVVSQ